MTPAPLTPEKFWDRIAVTAPSECWLWTGSVTRTGYGQVGYQRTTWAAHRLAWTLTFGTIPEGRVVCHRCDNPPCCNPAHLFLGSQADNMRDMWDKGRGHDGSRAERGVRRYNAKLNEEKVRQIRRLATEGTPVAAIASMFSVDPSNVRQVVKRTAWKHVP